MGSSSKPFPVSGGEGVSEAGPVGMVAIAEAARRHLLRDMSVLVEGKVQQVLAHVSGLDQRLRVLEEQNDKILRALTTLTAVRGEGGGAVCEGQPPSPPPTDMRNGEEGEEGEMIVGSDAEGGAMLSGALRSDMTTLLTLLRQGQGRDCEGWSCP